MREYIVQSPTGMFLTGTGGWSAEYPNAKLFASLQAARRAVDNLTPAQSHRNPIGIYTTEDYAMGRDPTETV
jgi:hypothetical protein